MPSIDTNVDFAASVNFHEKMFDILVSAMALFVLAAPMLFLLSAGRTHIAGSSALLV